MTDQVSQHSVTLDTLALLQETLDYLNRLPVVPVTHALCRKIAAHLEEPTVASAKRLALENERLANTRVAQMYSPAGTLLAEVIVTADAVTYRFPEIETLDSLRTLRTGETLEFR